MFPARQLAAHAAKDPKDFDAHHSIEAFERHGNTLCDVAR
jgi:hypothetical protein